MFSLTNRDPFRRAFTDLVNPLESWVSEVDPMFRPFVGSEIGVGGEFRGQMKSDFYEKDNEYVLVCELAGVNKQDIDVSIDGNQVTITCYKRLPSCCTAEGVEGGLPDPKWNFQIKERHLGKTQRIFKLPANADFNHAIATNENGLLTLQFPKITSSATHRKLMIQG